MGGDNAGQANKKRKLKWSTSYSNMSLIDAEKRLGFMMEAFISTAIPVHKMLATAQQKFEGPGADTILNIKDKVYDAILQYLFIEGYPGTSTDFNEANISDLVLFIISPILASVKRYMSCQMFLWRKKEITSTDSVTGDKEEFVLLDLISIEERNFVLIVEVKTSSLTAAMKQCLLLMKDLRDNNENSIVYSFVTIGER